MSKTYTLTEDQLQAAVRRALGAFYEYLRGDPEEHAKKNSCTIHGRDEEEISMDIDELCEVVVDDVLGCAEWVIEHPCPCPDGINCHFRSFPRGDVETSHCACGGFVPRGPKGTTVRCVDCDEEYAADDDPPWPGTVAEAAAARARAISQRWCYDKCGVDGRLFAADAASAGAMRCDRCGTEYVAVAPEGEDEPAAPYVAPEDLDADDDGIVNSDLVEEARYRSEQPELDDLDDDAP